MLIFIIGHQKGQPEESKEKLGLVCQVRHKQSTHTQIYIERETDRTPHLFKSLAHSALGIFICISEWHGGEIGSPSLIQVTRFFLQESLEGRTVITVVTYAPSLVRHT